MGTKQVSVKVEETEITLEKSDNLKRRLAETERNGIETKDEWPTENEKTAGQIDREGIRGVSTKEKGKNRKGSMDSKDTGTRDKTKPVNKQRNR